MTTAGVAAPIAPLPAGVVPPLSVPKYTASKVRFSVFDSKPAISIGLRIVTVAPVSIFASGTAAQASPVGVLRRR